MANDGEGKIRTRGFNHVVLVCKNMAEAVHFYGDILGFRLVKTSEVHLDSPKWGGLQHFFFDVGNDNLLAFLWYPEAPNAQPGVSSAPVGGGLSAHGSMNHLAFDVAPEMLEVYRQRLLDNGIEVSPIVNHDDSPATVSPEVNETTYVRAIYFTGPDGVRLELAANVRRLRPDEAMIPANEMDSGPASREKKPEGVS